MRNALTAIFGLALAFTFSCSSDNDDGSSTQLSSSSSELSNSPNYSSSSSSSMNSSSSEESSSSDNSSSSVGSSSSSSSVNSSSSEESSSSDNSSSSIGDSSSSSEQSSSSVPDIIDATDITDSRDNQTYKIVVIGTQVWMARNLNYNVNGSKCQGNKTANCDSYGRLYDWEMATTVCPSGWHLPSADEWEQLMDYIESEKDCRCAGKHLKAKSGWDNDGNGPDSYNFSALPGGSADPSGSFEATGYHAIWWSSASDGDRASGRSIEDRYDGLNYNSNSKLHLYSVRCLKD